MNAFSGQVLRVAVATAILGVSATTMASPPTTFVGLSPLAPDHMAQLTGGLAVGGLKVDLTASVRTYINDRLAAAEDFRITRLNDAQQRIQARLSRVDNHVTETPDTTANQISPNNAPATSTSQNTRTENTQIRGGGLRTRTIDEGDGGVTSMTFDFGRDQLVSTISNTANNRHIHQRVNIEVQVSNFREFASNVRSSLLAERVGRAVNAR